MKPRKLKLLPNLRWTGHMRVEGRTEGGWIVQWDAVDRHATLAPYIYDRCVLTTEQIRDWTGVELTEEPET